jgi:heptosyltransferase I
VHLGRILVVRLGAMGDIVHALPAAASLKHSFPGWRVTWVVEPRWAPLLEANPFVDRVVLLDRRTARAWRAPGASCAKSDSTSRSISRG